jgi:hypothetical protein
MSGVAFALIVKKVAIDVVFIRCTAGISPASKEDPLEA